MLKKCDTTAVVVVLPFVPVIAIKGVFVLRYANSTSEMIFIFFSFIIVPVLVELGLYTNYICDSVIVFAVFFIVISFNVSCAIAS